MPGVNETPRTTWLYRAGTTVWKDSQAVNVVTAEDPIEYVYEQFSQSEVNERIGNTFASYLRAFLRHDPGGLLPQGGLG